MGIIRSKERSVESVCVCMSECVCDEVCVCLAQFSLLSLLCLKMSQTII